MQKYDFTAWSIHTGPSHLKNIINNNRSPWVAGYWDAANDDFSATEMKKDIDARIELLLNAFDQSIGCFKTNNRTFMVPEFFFRCKQGPYPFIKLDGNLYPFEYIETKIKARLLELIPKDKNFYNVVIGTVLTSNIIKMISFFKAKPLLERLENINQVLHNLESQPSHLDLGFWFRNLTIPNPAFSADMAKINNAMKGYRANPLCTVRNRGIYFHYNSAGMTEPQSFVFEKQYQSAIDLTMGLSQANGLTIGNMVSEWMCNYNSYDITNGDKQNGAFATNARFQPQLIGNRDIGVEICYDHYLSRIRRTVDMTIANGAAADNYPILKQLIPSAGMQIHDYAVAAGSGCPIFNADGFAPVYTPSDASSEAVLDGKPGVHTGITCGVYAKSVQSYYKGKDGNTYTSHSQLAFTTANSTIGSYNNALGVNNVKAATFDGAEQSPSNEITDSYSPRVIPLNQDSELFAAGTGELHYYEPM